MVVDARAYDRIGRGYARHRRTDPRIAGRVHAALGGARRIVDVGAGAGAYEPAGRTAVAVEPSRVMIAQRGPGAAPAVAARAEALPFRDRTFDGALAVLTIHHWSDPAAGLRELRRVAAGPVVVLTFENPGRDPGDEAEPSNWVWDYFPEFRAMDMRSMPDAATIAAALPGARTEIVPVPRDCVDGFLFAWWARPEAFLDADVRAGISSFADVPGDAPGLRRLARDLASGAWAERWASDADAADFGYRLVVAPPG